MTWRRLHWILFIVVAVVAVIRIVTGNLIGAIFPIILATIFASIAADYPILSKLRRWWRFGRTLTGGKKGSS